MTVGEVNKIQDLRRKATSRSDKWTLLRWSIPFDCTNFQEQRTKTRRRAAAAARRTAAAVRRTAAAALWVHLKLK